MVMGTVGYMSPEQVRGKPVDHRTDIFAFGAILYEMLAGKRAFQRDTSAETMTAILNDDRPALRRLCRHAPPGLQRVVHRCLEKNPEQRFHSASDLAFASKPCRIPEARLSTLFRGSRVHAGYGKWRRASSDSDRCAGIAWWRTPPAVPIGSRSHNSPTMASRRAIRC